MYIRQTDLFWGLSQNVVNRVMGIAEREAFAQGDVLFRSDDAARHLFILAQGEVKIAMDDSNYSHQVYPSHIPFLFEHHFNCIFPALVGESILEWEQHHDRKIVTEVFLLCYCFP